MRQTTLQIHGCTTCPHRLHDWRVELNTCLRANRPAAKDPCEIPDWCPLPKAPRTSGELMLHHWTELRELLKIAGISTWMSLDWYERKLKSLPGVQND